MSAKAGLGPGDRLVLAMSAGAILLPAVLGTLARNGLQALPSTTVCASRIIFGLECPGCGLTRSFVALAGGDVPGAMGWNWAGPPLFALLVLVVITRMAKRARPDARGWRYVDAALGAAVVMTLLARAVWFYLR